MLVKAAVKHEGSVLGTHRLSQGEHLTHGGHRPLRRLGGVCPFETARVPLDPAVVDSRVQDGPQEPV
jgi:hypothetical protein